MRLLRDSLGTIETEIFIANVTQKGFDYTEWRKNLWGEISLDELLSKATKFSKDYYPREGLTII